MLIFFLLLVSDNYKTDKINTTKRKKNIMTKDELALTNYLMI